MKKVVNFIVIMTFLLMSSTSYALFNADYTDNSVNQDSENTNCNQNKAYGGDANQKQGQAQGQGQAQAAIAAQMQGQANLQGTNVKVDGDTTKYTNYEMTAPDTIAQKGQSAFPGYSIFGGINLAETEEATICLEKIICISQMEKAGLLTKEEAISEAKAAFKQLKQATRPKRILSIGPKTRGRHLFNGFGILATDSAYDGK